MNKNGITIAIADNLTSESYQFTSYHNASIRASFNELKSIFDNPMECDGCKTHYCFHLLLISQSEGYRVITIYDYKEVEGEFKNDKRITWHIGGNGKRETLLARETLNEYLADVRSGRVFVTTIKKDTICPLKIKNKQGDCVMVASEHCFFCCDYFGSINENKGIIVCVKDKNGKI